MKIKSIAIGKTKSYKFGKKEFKSAYKKDKFYDSIKVNTLGLVGDEQVDKRFHGGLDKAILSPFSLSAGPPRSIT